MKKLLATGLLVVGLLGIAGCEDPIPANMNLNPPMQVTMADDWLASQLLVKVYPAEHVGAGQLKITVELYNRTGDHMNVDYKYYFTDKYGAKVEDSVNTGWEGVPGGVGPHGTAQFTLTSLSAAPEDFRLQLRKAK